MSSPQCNCHAWLVALMLSLLAIIGCTADNASEHLTSKEREWLANHPVIRLAYETGYPPFTFVDTQGQMRGLSVDYIRLLERNLGIRFEIVTPDNLNVNLNKARSGDVDVLTSLMQTPERSKYLLFTKPYVSVPSVIIVNKGYTGPVTLDNMQGIRIAVCTDYAVTGYVQKKYPSLNLVSVSNELISLRMLSLGEVDAAVVDMASASHIIQTEGISNLRVAGDTGFTYNLSMASRSDWPLLNQILDKGLAGISAKETQTIQKKWITLEHAPVSRAVRTGILVMLGLSVIVIIGVILWNRTLVRMVAKQTGELHTELVERRQAEAALLMSKERLNLATQAAGIGIWDWDVANNHLTWDDSMYPLYGIRKEDFTGAYEAWKQSLHPDDMFHAEAEIQAALRGQREYVSEFRIVRPDGMVRFIQADSHTFFADDGTPRRMLGVNYDITERKQAEEALRTSEQSLRNLLMAMPIAVALNDEHQMITFRNRRYLQMFGYTEDEVPSVAEWMRRAYPDEQVREWVTKTWQGAVQKARDEGTDIGVHEYPVTCKNGEVRIVEIAGIMLGKEMLITLLDVTERKRAENIVRKALTEKETLIRELYHRTKNNMQIVRSLMSLQAGDAGAETRAIVKEVDNRIQGLALVHEMLYQSSDLSNLDLTAYLDALVRAIARNFWGIRSLVTVDLSGEPLPVNLDVATPCGLVINELLSNTFKYAFPDGRRGVITVRISRDGPEYLLLKYADNGVGLPEGFDSRSQETLGMQSIFAIVEQQLRGEVRIVSTTAGLTFALRIATGHYQERV